MKYVVLAVVVAGLALTGEAFPAGSDQPAQSKTRSRYRNEVEKVIALKQLSKPELQKRIKELQVKVIQSEKPEQAAKEAVSKAERAYKGASDEQKPEALIRMLEARAAYSKAKYKAERLRKYLKTAEDAYCGKVENELWEKEKSEK